MTTELISEYVKECIDSKSMGFTTDFGVGKMVSTHVYYNTGEMVVTIRASKETRGFSISCPESIIDWIYDKIN